MNHLRDALCRVCASKCECDSFVCSLFLKNDSIIGSENRTISVSILTEVPGFQVLNTLIFLRDMAGDLCSTWKRALATGVACLELSPLRV